jgi:hypothetical protein
MVSIPEAALALGLGWASGLRLYAICFGLGLLARFHLVQLPGALDVLGNPWLLGASALLFVGEFLADKIPAFDSMWDTVHTFIRGPGGAALAAMALQGQSDVTTQTLMALLAGGVATATHLGKAGARIAINHSPEPFSNIAASGTEDVLSLGIVWLALTHPYLSLAALGIFLLLLAWLLPKIWRLVRASFKRLGALAS